MNKKIIVISAVLVLVLAGGIWRWKNIKDTKIVQQNAQKQEQQPSQTTQDNEQAIGTNNWKTYENTEHGFEIKYPSNLAFTFQNKFGSDGVANILLYDNKFVDVANNSNPLLAIMGKNVGYMELTVLTGKAFIKGSDFDFKNYVTLGLSGPGGKIAATQKLATWIPIQSLDKKTVIYFYTTDVTDVDTLKSLGHSNGAVWIANGSLFSLMPKGDEQQVASLVDLYKNIALTFSQK